MHKTCSSIISFLLASLFKVFLSLTILYLITFKVVPWLQLFISRGGFHEFQLAGGKPAHCLYKGWLKLNLGMQEQSSLAAVGTGLEIRAVNAQTLSFLLIL